MERPHVTHLENPANLPPNKPEEARGSDRLQQTIQ